MAEWLRRLTRNQIPYGSAGSNPAVCVIIFSQFHIEFRVYYQYLNFQNKKRPSVVKIFTASLIFNKSYTCGNSNQDFFIVNYLCKNADVAEWLRRLTRNQIPYGSVGSNPTSCDFSVKEKNSTFIIAT